MVTHPALQQPVIDAVDISSVAEFYRASHDHALGSAVTGVMETATAMAFGVSSAETSAGHVALAWPRQRGPGAQALAPRARAGNADGRGPCGPCPSGEVLAQGWGWSSS